MLIKKDNSITDELEKRQLIIHLTDINQWILPQAFKISEKFSEQKTLFDNNTKEYGMTYLEPTESHDDIAIGSCVCLSDNALLQIPFRVCLKQIALFCIECDINTIKIQKTDLKTAWKVIEDIIVQELIEGYKFGEETVKGYDFDVEVYDK